VYLDMGTDYDDFSPRAQPDFSGLSEQQRINRSILQEVMLRHGFIQHPFEWWHFDYRPEHPWTLIDDETMNFS